MPVQLSWYLEHHVIQIINSGTITDQDMLDADQPIIDYFNESNVPLVHLIVDNSNASYTPSVKAVTKAKFPKHAKCGWVLLVGPANSFMRFVNAVVSNVFKTRNRMFETFDEALDFLNDMDSSLPPLRDREQSTTG